MKIINKKRVFVTIQYIFPPRKTNIVLYIKLNIVLSMINIEQV